MLAFLYLRICLYPDPEVCWFVFLHSISLAYSGFTMSHGSNSIELEASGKQQPIPVSVDASARPPEDSNIYNVTRTRKVFSFSQLFAFSLTYMALWEGMCS